MTDVRPWREGDDLDALLDDVPDPLWAAQGHRLHGAARDGERWRRTWVADLDGSVVGAVTLGRNPVHPGRYSCAVEVAPAHRRSGLALELVRTALDARPGPLPLAGKIRERDRAATALLAALGGSAYQRCACPEVDPSDPAVRAWSAQRPGARALTGIEPAGIAEAFAAMYRWQHAGWSPVGSESALAGIAAASAAETDPELGSFVSAGGRPAAIALAFRAGDRVDVVAETVTRDEPDGVAVLAAAVGRTLERAAAAGIALVEFDGHDDDPHLVPVLASLPVARRDPLLLVEVR